MHRTLITFASLAALLAVPLATHADDDDDAVQRAARPPPVTPRAAPPGEALYKQECASCHMAYPPGLLPERSWRKLLGGLDDHFGQNAELDEPARRGLERWLSANAAESGTLRKSGKVLRSLRGSTPLRISQLPYIAGKHDEISPRVFERSSVTSRANCVACHRGAEQGSFSEDDVKIPR